MDNRTRTLEEVLEEKSLSKHQIDLILKNDELALIVSVAIEEIVDRFYEIMENWEKYGPGSSLEKREMRRLAAKHKK